MCIFFFIFQIHSFSTCQTPKDNEHLPPSPNGQGQRVHSSSWNWLTQGHSWNIGGEGVHVVEISVTPKTNLKRPVTGLAPVTDAGPCQLNLHGCQSKWGRVLLPAVTGNICRHTWMRNVKWESAGRTGMFTLLATIKKNPLLLHVFNAIPARTTFHFIWIIIMHTVPWAWVIMVRSYQWQAADSGSIIYSADWSVSKNTILLFLCANIKSDIYDISDRCWIVLIKHKIE